MSTAAVIPFTGELDAVGERLRPGAHVFLAAADARELLPGLSGARGPRAVGTLKELTNRS